MLRSMYSAISGLKNFQTKMDVVGNNISNVNTFGFKKSRVTFSDLVSQQLSGASSPQANRGGINPKQIGLGSTIGSVDTVQTQGSLQTTGRDLDLAISGDGYFIANSGNNSYYTRAGNLYLDKTGNLVTANGLYIQGYPIDENTGKLDDSKIGNLQIDSGSFMVPKSTSQMSLSGNLSNTSTDSVPLKFNVVDSQGTEHSLTMTFTKASNNTWAYKVSADPDDKTLDKTNLSIDGTSDIEFDTNGKLISPTNENQPEYTKGDPIRHVLHITSSKLNNDTDPIDIEVDLSQITQVNAGNSVYVKDRDGNTKGYLESFSIGSSGEITGVYTNGNTKQLGQIALANFANPGGLTKEGNNLFSKSNNSGKPVVGRAGDGRGTLNAGTLEMSNVDLSEEFTDMIVAQRGFQSNARVITSSDEILQELVNLKR